MKTGFIFDTMTPVRSYEYDFISIEVEQHLFADRLRFSSLRIYFIQNEERGNCS